MPELGSRPEPKTSPPFIPEPPTRNLPMNVPPFPAPAQTMTQEEIDAEYEAEMAAREADMVAAEAEEIASNEAMAALEGAFVPNGISRHRGVGPIQYETRRGLIKVFPGDLVCHVVGPTNPDAPEEEWILEDDFIICSQAVLGALLFTVDWKLYPDTLEYRANRIGEERRAAAALPPVELARKDGESDVDYKRRQEQAEADRQKKILDDRKKKAEEGKKLPPKPTQLPSQPPPVGARPPQATQIPAPPPTPEPKR
jgi:hypothetical protein